MNLGQKRDRSAIDTCQTHRRAVRPTRLPGPWPPPAATRPTSPDRLPTANGTGQPVRRSPARSPGDSTHDPLATIGAPGPPVRPHVHRRNRQCLAAGAEPVAATIETTLTTRDAQIRQLAFDGDATSFESAEPPGADDHFTLVLDRPVRLRSIAAVTGRPTAATRSGPARSRSPTTARPSASSPGSLAARPGADRPTGPSGRSGSSPAPRTGPIAIRELTIDSDPPVATFRYPVEFVVDTAEAPDLKPWTESAARACECAYALINDELGSDGYRPPRRIWLELSKSYRGVAKMSGDHIVGSAEHFRGHRKDVGAIVHETVHVAQGYRRGERPSWLVEGICDYIRFFKWEPGNLGRIDPRTAHYHKSYRVTAAFLAYLVATYDEDIVRKVNRRCARVVTSRTSSSSSRARPCRNWTTNGEPRCGVERDR